MKLKSSDLVEPNQSLRERLNKVHPAVLAQIFADREKPIMANPWVWKNPKNLRLVEWADKHLIAHSRKGKQSDQM